MSSNDQFKIKSILKIRNNIDTSSCFLDNPNIGNIKSFGDESQFGDISKVSISNDKDSSIAILKKIPVNKFNNPRDLSSTLGAELKFLELISELTDIGGITRNFSTMAGYSICSNCNYQNPNLIKKQEISDNSSYCVTTVSPFSDSGTFKDFLQNYSDLNDEIIAIAYFQIFSGIYILQNYFNASHHDLHWSNVFLTKNPDYQKGTYELYKIAKREYYVPSCPFIFQIADFGFARIPGLIDISQYKPYYEQEAQNPRLLADYMRITSMLWSLQKLNRMSFKTQEFLQIISELYKAGTPLVNLFPLIFPSALNKPSKTPTIVNIWDLEKKVPTFNYELSKFVRPEMIDINGDYPMIPAPPNSPVTKSRFKNIITSLFSDVLDRMDID